MTEELKYKVGDKVLVEMEIIKVEDFALPYLVRQSKTGVDNRTWVGTEHVVELPPKPKVTQAVMDWYECHKTDNWNINGYLRHVPEELEDWLFYTEDNLKNQHALASLIAYGPEAVEVEKEKKYKVKLKPTGQWLREEFGSFDFGRQVSKTFTKQELIKAGFEGVFDNPMFEVEEVE